MNWARLAVYALKKKVVKRRKNDIKRGKGLKIWIYMMQNIGGENKNENYMKKTGKRR